MNKLSTLSTQVVAAICPVAPPGAQAYADKLTGYVLWGVLILFLVGIVVGIGAIVAGRVFSMPHASKAGVVGVVVVFMAAVGYMVLPGMVSGITGAGLRGMSAVAADSEGAWDRRRLLVILASAGLAAALLVVGLGYAMYSAVTSTVTATATGTGKAAGPAVAATSRDTPVRGQAHRDTVSAAAMLRVRPDDSRQGTPAAAPLPTITIPAATQTGPVQVSTGFPHTSEGGLGQLAAIETAVLQAMSIAQATEVYGAWAMPGGVGAPQWELTGAVQAFLGSRSGGQAKAITTVITATPAAGLVKGADGDDWVLACVLLDVRAVVATEARIGYGHCERMQWTAGRWLIAPGPAPARAPSTWPGTDLARQAGWRTWTPAGAE